MHPLDIQSVSEQHEQQQNKLKWEKCEQKRRKDSLYTFTHMFSHVYDIVKCCTTKV